MTSVWLGTKVSMDEAPLRARVEEVCEPTFHKATLVNRIHPVPGRDSEPCVSSGIGMWRSKIYHFLPDKPPSSGGDEIQTELFVKFEDFPFVAERIYRLAPLFADYLQITELRPVAMDNIPLSPAKGRDTMGIHFTWKHDFDNIVMPVMQLQLLLAEFDYRPHYGKFFHPLFEQDFKGDFAEDVAKLRQMIEEYDETDSNG